MIFVVNIISGQKLSDNAPSKSAFFLQKTPHQNGLQFNTYNGFNKLIADAQLQYKINRGPVFFFRPYSKTGVSADFYTQHFGFFCKKELQFEKLRKSP